MKTERIIRVHFIGQNTLELSGAHVEPFVKNYTKAVTDNAQYFMSQGEDTILINIPNVTFIEETWKEPNDVPF